MFHLKETISSDLKITHNQVFQIGRITKIPRRPQRSRGTARAHKNLTQIWGRTTEWKYGNLHTMTTFIFPTVLKGVKHNGFRNTAESKLFFKVPNCTETRKRLQIELTAAHGRDNTRTNESNALKEGVKAAYLHSEGIIVFFFPLGHLLMLSRAYFPSRPAA